jgi:hypothetical protein
MRFNIKKIIFFEMIILYLKKDKSMIFHSIAICKIEEKTTGHTSIEIHENVLEGRL